MINEKKGFSYPRNLRFRCIKCGLCCGDTEKRYRNIFLLRKEAEEIAREILKPIYAFAVKSEEMVPYYYKMKKGENGKCVFLKNEKCTIYSVRPLICRFYPFELKGMSKNEYKFLFTEECPGLNKGRLLGKNYFQKMFNFARRKFESIAASYE